MVGGDSASRAVAIGVVLGAACGVDGIPQHLRDTFINYHRYDKLLDTLPALKNMKLGRRQADGIQ